MYVRQYRALEVNVTGLEIKHVIRNDLVDREDVYAAEAIIEFELLAVHGHTDIIQWVIVIVGDRELDVIVAGFFDRLESGVFQDGAIVHDHIDLSLDASRLSTVSIKSLWNPPQYR